MTASPALLRPSPGVRRRRLPRRGPLVLGLGATLVVALGSLATGRLARTPATLPLVSVQGTAGVRPVGQLLLFLGIGLLVVAWAWLGRVVRGRPDGPAIATRAGFLWSAPLLLTPPTFSGDLWSYVANALIAARGLSPYDVTPAALTGPVVEAVSARWRNSPAPYGPVPLLWGDLAARGTTSPWLVLLAFRVLALVGVGLLALAVPRIARLTGRDPGSAAWLAVASPFTVLHGVASAHVDVVMSGLLACGLLLALRGRWLVAAVLVGVSAAVKVPALLAVVPVGLAWAATSVPSWRTRVHRVSRVALVAVVVLFALGPLSGFGNGWVTGLGSPLSALSPLSLTTRVGLLASRATGLALVGPAHVAGTVAVGLLAAVVVLRSNDGAPAEVVRAGALVMSVAVVLSPVDHLWYFFWALPLLAATTLTARPRRTVVSVTTALALVSPWDAGQHLPGAGVATIAGLLLSLLAAVDVRRTRDLLVPSGRAGRSGR